MWYLLSREKSTIESKSLRKKDVIKDYRRIKELYPGNLLRLAIEEACIDTDDYYDVLECILKEEFDQ